MRTVKTTYGNPKLKAPVEYQIGIEQAESGRFYVKVQFANKSWFRTDREYSEDRAKGIVVSIAKHTRNQDFPYNDKHGQRRFFPYNPDTEVDFSEEE